ncbi:MAG TPA: hypothetical protein VK791_06355 [bacterium]|jgi:hypothetical protein|nr:hypothetical protein [bacterium]
MKFENKKWVLRVALAGALSLGVATVAKADSTAAAAPTFSVIAQELAQQTFGTYSGTGAKTTTTSSTGDTLGFSLQHVILGSTYSIDAIDTLTVSSELVGGFNLLNAYDTHSLGDIYSGLALKVGQFQIPFGYNQYQTPDQLIRINYNTIDTLTSPVGIPADSAQQFDLGAELDQNWDNLSLQVAVVQNNGAINSTGNKDWAGRAQWKSQNVLLGVSDYYQASSVGVINNTNFFGANGSVLVDIFRLDLEAIWGNQGNNANGNGYSAILSAKTNGFQPAVWYEFTNSNASNIPAAYNNMATPDLGAGLNFDLAAKTRLAIDVDFTGYNANNNGGGDLLAANTERVQLQEVF